uniref:Adenosine kinase n=1 Tax=Lotharella globosa TaxID=91324 RepID=A0A7S3YYI0_9EUKA
MPSAGGATKACLLGVGHPLLDISSEVDSKLVQRYGLSMDNTIMAEEKHVNLYVEMERLPTVKYIAGGSTLNTIRVAQWMLQVPEATSFVGCVGKDAAAEKLRACVARDHVEAHFCIDHKFPTGKCACLIVDKERSLVTDLQAARQYRKDHLLTKHMTPVCDAAKIIYVAGFMINGTFDTVMHLAEKCSKQDTRFCMNLSAPFLMTVKHFASLFQKVVPYIDILFGNEIEAIAFGQMMGWVTIEPERIFFRAKRVSPVNRFFFANPQPSPFQVPNG